MSILLNHGPFPDSDGDGLRDPDDTCTDRDDDGFGDPDFENLCQNDNCPALANPSQADADGDGAGDLCDVCPAAADPSQADADGDGRGDACDPCPLDPLDDVDGDGACADEDLCPTVPEATSSDGDSDGFGDACDNCPGTANPSQADGDGDGTGNVCEPRTRDTLFGIPLIGPAGFQDVADFDGDGVLDLLGIGSSSIAVRPGLGGGVFGVDVVTPLSTNGGAFGEVRDYDGDSILDVAVVDRDPAGFESGRLRMMRGRGDGAFYLIQTLAFNRLPAGIDSADFNGDAELDLAIALLCISSSSCSSDQSRAVLFRGVGDGTMALIGPLVTGNVNANAVAAGDVDGDGDSDLAFAQVGSAMRLFRGAGNGTFVRQDFSACGTAGLAMADLDADGRDELLAGCSTSPLGKLAIIGAEGPAPVVGVTYDTPFLGAGLAAADFDGDGNLDVALPQGVVLFGDGDGFLGPARAASGSSFFRPKTADLNGDGRLDLVASSGSGFTAILLNQGDDTFAVMPPAFGGGGIAVGGGDFDEDGQRDVATVGSTPTQSELVTLNGNGEGFAKESTAALPNQTAGDGLAAGDLDADGHLDLVVAASNVLAVYRGQGDGSFSLIGTLPTGDLTRYPVIGDFNADGAADVACSSTFGVRFVPGHGDGTFGPVVAVNSQRGVPVAAHLDSDPHLDLAVAVESTDAIEILMGNGDGTFTPRTGVIVGDSPRSLVSGDFDGDGNTDLATLNVLSGGTVSVVFGDAGGFSAAPLTLALDPSVTGLSAADFDADGRDDVVVTYLSHIAVYYGDAGRSFPAPARFSGAGTIRIHGGLEASDFNRDGRPDLAIGTSSGVALLLNRGAPVVPPPPTAVITGALVVECSAPGAGMVHLDGSSSHASGSPPGVGISAFEWFIETPGGPVPAGTAPVLDVARPLGSTVVTLRVTDQLGQSGSAQATVNVVDTAAPALFVTASPTQLFPPNHRLVDVEVQGIASDVCDPAPVVLLTGVVSDEPDDAPGGGDGMTLGDVRDADVGTRDALVQLRAERNAQGDGRAYTLSYQAVDGSGNSASRDVVVTAPLNVNGQDDPLVVQVEHAGGPAAYVSWSATGDSYDVITGILGGFVVVDSELRLGSVEVLGRGIVGNSVLDSPPQLNPAPGQAVFYFVQYHESAGASGYGTATAFWPLVPTTCSGGCP